MSDALYPDYFPQDLAMNEVSIIDGYVETIRALWRESGLLPAGASEQAEFNVSKYALPAMQGGLRVRDLRVYQTESHIYHIEARAAGLQSPTVQMVGNTVMQAFKSVEHLAAQFNMATNPKFPLTSSPSFTKDGDFVATIATRRTLDEFFTLGIESLKQRIDVLQAAASSVPAASGLTLRKPV